MAHYYKKQEEWKKLEANDEDSYLYSAWAKPVLDLLNIVADTSSATVPSSYVRVLAVSGINSFLPLLAPITSITSLKVTKRV
ncbi:hypothetical protein EG68_01680 [Paragonimus skrjabini miyazakii]|uniref:Uncharacterized protein n=1 Tax=Paragonimus skrjabini miyazakii TaxID=59628 RepID=A0A8S9Z2T1_9TREM|nr:hypothetical protein EG68_01680 [Paragonimus skrjabini miyazakii]